MGEKSNIEWCDDTHNFWEGCTKVSAGCTNCYAEARDKRFTGGIHWGKGAPRRKSKSFNEPLKWNKHPLACDACGYVTGEKLEPKEKFLHRKLDPQSGEELCGGPFHRRRVFSLSLGDWLDPEVPIEWLSDMMRIVFQCYNLDWILCTKRPELFDQRLEAVQDHDYDHGARVLCGLMRDWRSGVKVPKNVILLTSVENQEQADKRIPELLRIPAARRGLSCEPLLGPISLRSVFGHDEEESWLEWVIVGGESGKNARPCNIDWIRSIKEECQAAQVPVFVKQLGADPRRRGGEDESETRMVLDDKKGGDLDEWPEDLKVREFYK